MTLGFFEDILITPESLQYPSKFDEREQLWIWEYQTDDGEIHDMPMEKNSSIRFRITAENFNDTTPVPEKAGGVGSTKADGGQQPGPSKPLSGSANQPGGTGSEGGGAPKKIPYFITGSINEPGLGLTSWWS